MQHLDYFQVFQHGEAIASGVKLPSGQFALSWYGHCHSHGVFPSFDVFKTMQDNRTGRSVKQIPAPLNSAGAARTFYLQRNEDWSGISGTGLVAVGFEFDHWTALYWLDAEGSTFWYPSVAMVERVHGHEGRTLIVRCPSARSCLRKKWDRRQQCHSRTKGSLLSLLSEPLYLVFDYAAKSS